MSARRGAGDEALECFKRREFVLAGRGDVAGDASKVYRRNGVEPIQGTCGPDTDRVESRHRARGDPFANGSINRFESTGAIGLQMGKRSLTEAAAVEEIAHDFAQRLEGQQLVFGQIDCHTFDPRSVPHQRDDI